MLWQLLFGEGSKGQSWTNYRTDIYFNLRWRWSYSETGQIYGVHTFCPHCDFQVYEKNVSPYRVPDHIAFQCESCGRSLGDFEESISSLENKVKRFIQQRLRNGTWVNASTPNSAG
jgi:hypothetical protein